eukprot:309345-Pleurochrysis_carterae.AAC.1
MEQQGVRACADARAYKPVHSAASRAAQPAARMQWQARAAAPCARTRTARRTPVSRARQVPWCEVW